MKVVEKRQKRLVFLGSLAGAAIVALFALSRIDVVTDLIGRKVTEAVEEATGLRLDMGSVRGNPLAGFTLEGLALRDGEGRSLLAAERVGASIAFSSLFSGSPALDELSVEGVSGDVAAFLAALPPSEGPSPLEAFLDEIHDRGAVSFPLSRLTMRRVDLATPGGALHLASGKASFGERGLDVDVDVLFRELPVKGEVALDFSGKTVVADLDVAVGKGRIEGKGAVEPLLDVTADLKGFDLADLARLWPDLAERGFAGTFATTLKARGAWSDPRLEGDLLFEGGRLSGIPFDVARTSWSYDVKSLSFPDVKARVAAIPLTGRMAFGLGQLPPDLDIGLSARDVAVADLVSTFPGLEGATGTIEAVTVTLGGRADSLKGKAFLRAPRFAYGGQTVTGLSVDALFGTDGRAKVSGGASWMGTALTVEGDVVYSPEIRFGLSLRAPEIDLSGLGALDEALAAQKPQGKASVTLKLQGNPSAYTVTGRAESARARLQGELFEGTKAEFSYAASGLDLKDFQSRWGQAALSASGKVTGLAGGKAHLALSGKVTNLDVASLVAFAPALGSVRPSGKVSLDWKADGPVASPTFAVTATSSRLDAEPAIRLEGVRASGSFSPGGKALLAAPLDVAVDKIGASGAVVEALSASVQMEGSRIRLSDLSARLGGGSLAASGTIDTAKAPQALDLKGTVKGVDLSKVLTKDLLPVVVAGRIDGDVSLSGTTEAPSFSVKASSPALTVADLAVTALAVEASGTPSTLTVSRAEATVGGAPFSAKADLSRVGEGYGGTFSAQASAVDVALLTAKLPGAEELAMAGKVDFSLSGSADGKVLSGRGDLSSSSLRVRGMEVSNLKVPLLLGGDSLKIDGARANVAGGEAKGSASVVLERGTWTAEASVKGADLKAVTRLFAEGKGSLSGPADLSFKGNGNVTFGTVLGSGVLSVGEGELEGFRSAELLAKLHGSPRIRYRSILANYTVDSSGLQLLPGTRALAQPDDALYRTLEAEGSVGFDKKLDLDVRGNVNVQALNAFLGGIEGLLTSGGQTPEALLKGLFQGVTGSASQRDFRNVTLDVGGTTEAPKVSNIRIEQPLEPKREEAPAQGKDVQAAPEKVQPTDPGQILQQQILQKILGN